jgi:hypothetical protein
MLRNIEEAKMDRIEKKIKDAEAEKGRAVSKRVQELER